MVAEHCSDGRLVIFPKLLMGLISSNDGVASWPAKRRLASQQLGCSEAAAPGQPGCDLPKFVLIVDVVMGFSNDSEPWLEPAVVALRMVPFLAVKVLSIFTCLQFCSPAKTATCNRPSMFCWGFVHL